MKKLITLTAALVILSTSASFANNEEGTANRIYMPVKSSPNASKASYDIQFLDTMIAHHKQGIEMSEMAADKSQNETVKEKAQMLVDDEQGDISKLKEIRDEIQEKAPLAINTSLDGMSSSDVKGLNNESAKSFDKKFLKMTIAHREGTKEMAKEASKRAKNAKVKQIADQLANKQTGQIAELKEMLKNL